jgi:lysophospholipase L1-like esterase
MRFMLSFGLSLVSLAIGAVEIAPKPLLHVGDNLVFVGDSITGHSMNFGKSGFNPVIGRALQEAYPGNTIQLTSLGGSGQGIFSWANVEKGSREKPSFLDVKGVDVQQALTADVDVLVIMLGMNDSLSPNIADDDAGIAKWVEQYGTFVTTLRERCQPRLIALATVTPNTEDPQSPKNVLLARLNQQLPDLAARLDCVVLPVGEAVWELLAEGRRLSPDFHVTQDFVHPNSLGHAAMAYGMLCGLGERVAAEYVRSKEMAPHLAQLRQEFPVLSYEVRNVAFEPDGSSRVQVAWYWTGTEGKTPSAKMTVPESWSIVSSEVRDDGGSMVLAGALDHLQTHFHLTVEADGKTREQDVSVSAPWLIAHGFKNMESWKHGSWDYQPDQGAMPGEADILTGRSVDATPAGWKSPLVWSRLVPSMNHTGGDRPGNVSFFAVDYAAMFAGAYGLRWLHSDRERTLRLVIGANTFAGVNAAKVFMNGDEVYSGVVTKEPKHRAEREVTLHAGWNLLSFKANHLNWQWQISLDLESDESLDDLKASIIPQE